MIPPHGMAPMTLDGLAYNARMRTLIVSDIHSNSVALDAVFAAAEEDGPIDQVWCLGDIVGYGPAPMACLERLWEANAMSICGNHDAGAVERVSLDRFNPYAAAACRWTSEQLSDKAREYLTALPETINEDPFQLVHGAPRDPLWEYVFGYPQAIEVWEYTQAHVVLLGHSHLQFACEAGRGLEQPGQQGLYVPITNAARLVINPGSVGQPRDRDPRAGYAVYDGEAESVTLRRVWYDINITQRAMAEAGLPEPLITRLSNGT
ncbi:MAG: metallophosphoesterase family protein [Dehalococcoidia bacterium]